MDEILESIESEEFDLTFGIVNTDQMLIHMLAMNPYVKCLIVLLSTQQNQEKLLARFYALLEEPFDEKYANPKDVALASYLFSMATTNEAMGLAACHALHERDRNLFWSRRLATNIATMLSL